MDCKSMNCRKKHTEGLLILASELQVLPDLDHMDRCPNHICTDNRWTENVGVSRHLVGQVGGQQGL
jgi:hypothetical protein